MQEWRPVGTPESRREIIKNVLVLGWGSGAATLVRCEHIYGIREEEQLEEHGSSVGLIKWID